MSYYLAKSLVQLRNEVNSRWPDRNKASDGWIGDPSHQARVSDHNPDWNSGGVVRAIDITVRGIDVDLLIKHTINDSRVAYLIYNRRIYKHSTGWKPYTLANPHTSHVHVSIAKTATAENDTKAWFGTADPGQGNVHPGNYNASGGSGNSTTGSIVEYLNSKGRSSSFSARSTLAKRYGIRNYKGTAQQNTLLLSKVRADAKKVKPKPNDGDPNKYTVRSEAQIRRILVPITKGTSKNSTPHLIGLYQLQQIKPFTLEHDQIWGSKTDAHFRWVGQLQKNMNKWAGTKLKVDGSYGPATHARVLDLQERNHEGAYKGVIDNFAGPVFTGMLKMSKYPN